MSIFNTLRTLLRHRFGPGPSQPESRKLSDTVPEQTNLAETQDIQKCKHLQTQPAPYDSELLDTARMQWQFGEWETLAYLDPHRLEHHPDRAKLALLVASAWQQLNDHIAARRYLKLAKDWGCDKKLIASVLVAGVHNTLGRAAALNQNESRALSHFRSAVKGVNGDIKLASQARIQHELSYLGLMPKPASLLQTKPESIPQATQFPAQQKVLQLMNAIHPRTMRTIKKIRIGGMNDGGYVVPDCILKCDTLLSIGIGNDVSFDLALANQGINILQFDNTIDIPPEPHPRLFFEKKGWGAHTKDDILDFNDIFSRVQALSPKRLCLKFNVEGAEYEALENANANLLAQFDIIVCEIHRLDRLVNQTFFERVRHAIDKLTTHHVPIHLHANNYANATLVEGVPIPQVLEISFLRSDLDSFGEFSLDPIPGALDRPNNPSIPDICMTSW